MLGKTFLAVSTYDGTEPHRRASALERGESDKPERGLLRALLDVLRVG
jgi:hypothetical protein